jgi:hypothetical protein
MSFHGRCRTIEGYGYGPTKVSRLEHALTTPLAIAKCAGACEAAPALWSAAMKSDVIAAFKPVRNCSCPRLTNAPESGDVASLE